MYSKEFINGVIEDYKNGDYNIDTYIKEKGIPKYKYYKWTNNIRNNCSSFIDVTNLYNTSNSSSITINVNNINIIIDNDYNESLLLKVINSIKKI